MSSGYPLTLLTSECPAPQLGLCEAEAREFAWGYTDGQRAAAAGKPATWLAGLAYPPAYQRGFQAGHAAAAEQLPLPELGGSAPSGPAGSSLTVGMVTAAGRPADRPARRRRKKPDYPDEEITEPDPAYLAAYEDGYQAGLAALRAGQYDQAAPAGSGLYAAAYAAGFEAAQHPAPGQPAGKLPAHAVYLAAPVLADVADWTERRAARAALAEVAQLERLLGQGDWVHQARTHIYYEGV